MPPVTSPVSNIPVPDPSVLTTENLRREVGALRELLEVRLDGTDKVRGLLIENFKTLPALIDREVARVNDLLAARLLSLSDRFAEADIRYRERFDAADLRYQQRYDASDKALAAASQAAQGAVNAALAAAKEAVMAASVSAEKSVAAQNESNAASILKSEVSVTKQIDSIMTLVTSSSKNTDEKIFSLSSRLDRGEGAQKGSAETRTGVIALVIAIVAVLGLGASYLTREGASASHEAQTPVYYWPQSQPQPLQGFAPPSAPQVSVVPVVPVPVPSH